MSVASMKTWWVTVSVNGVDAYTVPITARNKRVARADALGFATWLMSSGLPEGTITIRTSRCTTQSGWQRSTMAYLAGREAGPA